MQFGEIELVQIAAVGNTLYGLRREGDVWWFDAATPAWKRLPMAFQQVVEQH